MKSGFGLLEIVVAVSLAAVALFSISAVSQVSLRVVEENTKKIQAAFLLEEGIEALKIMRDESWQTAINPLASNTDYFLEFTGNMWKATTTPVFVDGIFERKFNLFDVYRDINDDITQAGTLDADTKKIKVLVSWNSRAGTTTRAITTYITNLFNN